MVHEQVARYFPINDRHLCLHDHCSMFHIRNFPAWQSRNIIKHTKISLSRDCNGGDRMPFTVRREGERELSAFYSENDTDFSVVADIYICDKASGRFGGLQLRFSKVLSVILMDGLDWISNDWYFRIWTKH